ncbi:MAG: PmoA family protein [Candidatus Hydrogenedentes bacterium]|nr:PmoA family protein [Candidatus Hydrogenedentota bacterium]
MVGLATALALVISINSNEIILRAAEEPVFIYRYTDTPRKPYLMEWYTPNGVNVLRDAPHDHLHHHGMMYAITVDGVNYWEESDTGGYQIHQKISTVHAAPDADTPGVGFQEVLLLQGSEFSEPVLKEERSIYHSPLSNGRVRVLTWKSSLQTASDKEGTVAKISGTVYHGLGMRFPEFMDHSGTFIMADDETDVFEEGPHAFAQASWCAYTVEDEETPITVAMFNCPDNPRPTLWFTMLNPFSYLSATQDLNRKPMNLKAGEVLSLCYGIAAWDAVVDKSEIEVLYSAWLHSLKK